jgi:hypothetical protein
LLEVPDVVGHDVEPVGDAYEVVRDAGGLNERGGPKTKTWKELGFNIPEPADTFPDSRAWFDNLTDDTQRAIMGPERLQLLQSGAVGWDDLTVKRSTDGWRDSMHVTPVKDLRAVQH